jgi:hypothetical protein
MPRKKRGSPPTSDKEVAMKRFLALLALVLILMGSTAGIASAATLDFTSPPPYSDITIEPDPNDPSLQLNLLWSDDSGGHLYCSSSWHDSIITFTTPTYVNKFEMTGMPWSNCSFEFYFGPMNIAAFDAAGGSLWSTTVDFLIPPPSEDPEYYSTAYNWLTVYVNQADVSKIIFYAPNPNGVGYDFTPSIDNLVINEAAGVPIPASVWLLGSGLLALVGLRRKFTH